MAATRRGQRGLPECLVPWLARALWLTAMMLALPWSGRAFAQEVQETHYPSGELKERYETNEAGQKAGLYERFRTDGTLEERAQYKADQLDGLRTQFDAAGRLEVESHYSRGLRFGSWVKYQEGSVVLKARYEKDQLNGRFERFLPDGRRLLQAQYKKGLLDGKYIESKPDAHWERNAKYKAGVLDGKATIEIAGKVQSQRTWKNGRLVDLDGIVPYPLALDALTAELAEASRVGPIDPQDPQSADRQGELARLKAYRALCRIPWKDLTLNPEWNALCDAAGELCKAIGHLDHTPSQPPGMDDKAYARGYQGTSNSNLSSGGLRGSVDSYMNDSDPSNIDRIGHRRWCLNPNMAKTGFGSAGQWAAMWSMDSSGPGARGLTSVMYPPPGYVPSDMFGPRHAWSIHLLSGRVPTSKDAIEVTMHRLDENFLPAGDALQLDWKDLGGGGYGGSPCIVFRPESIEVRPGSRYAIQISLDQGKSIAFDYLVEFCAPTREPRQRR